MGIKRKIIRIDEEKCNGCGECVTSCAEGAIQVIDGKARLMSETYCDGLGACIGECPVEAITIEEREAEEFNEAAVAARLHSLEDEEKLAGIVSQAMLAADNLSGGHGCPGSMMRMLQPQEAEVAVQDDPAPVPSQLRNWPVQLKLAPVAAPYFAGAQLLISADCVAFANGSFHADYLRGKTVLIGCPKLDDTDFYREKLTQILRHNSIRGIEVLFMEVPCCFGLANLVQQGVVASGKSLPVTYTRIGIGGEEQGSSRQ
ncbi:MAG TPA: 4Fe-4S binding protein [Candidatus Glassbacteria bacterium]|nr:4Fe-4S binding protein [Candidatus Glassbacteria bacterium]